MSAASAALLLAVEMLEDAGSTLGVSACSQSDCEHVGGSFWRRSSPPPEVTLAAPGSRTTATTRPKAYWAARYATRVLGDLYVSDMPSEWMLERAKEATACCCAASCGGPLPQGLPDGTTFM